MVVEIKKAVGDKVKASETVMVIEAMKMMNSLLALADGIVKEINVEISDSVSKGDVLMEMEPEM